MLHKKAFAWKALFLCNYQCSFSKKKARKKLETWCGMILDMTVQLGTFFSFSCFVLFLVDNLILRVFNFFVLHLLFSLGLSYRVLFMSNWLTRNKPLNYTENYNIQYFLCYRWFFKLFWSKFMQKNKDSFNNTFF